MLSPSRCAIAVLPAALLASGLLPAALRGDDRPGTEPPGSRQEPRRPARPPRAGPANEITPQLKLAVQRGFACLVRGQNESGGFAGSEGCEVAVNALAGLAFLAGGHTDRVGPYTETMRRTVHHLLRFQNSEGYFDDRKSRMYGHGFATLFLAELYGMTGGDEEVRAALKRAVKVIEGSQSSEGGWDYLPNLQFGGGGSRGESDTSITVCQAMALRAARNLGIQVNGEVVERARRYIRKAQNSDGGFCYRLGGPLRWGVGSQFPRSAAGVCILFSLAKPEEYNSTELRRGFEYLLGHYRSFNPFPYYGQYYCVQAMFQAGGKYWAEYFPYLREKLIASQEEDGSWSAGGLEVRAQATAMALIALQIPYRFLPITER